MNYFITILIIAGVIYLAAQYINYLKAVNTTPDAPRRKAVSFLLMGFISLISVTTIFADAIFELLGLEKPAQFEWMAFAAFVVFAIVTAYIFKQRNNIVEVKEEETSKDKAQSKQNNIEVNNSSFVSGRDTIIHINEINPEKKNDRQTKLITTKHRIKDIPEVLFVRDKQREIITKFLEESEEKKPEEKIELIGEIGIGKGVFLRELYHRNLFEKFDQIAWFIIHDNWKTAIRVQIEGALYKKITRKEYSEIEFDDSNDWHIAQLFHEIDKEGKKNLFIFENFHTERDKGLTDYLYSMENATSILSTRQALDFGQLVELEYPTNAAILDFAAYLYRKKGNEQGIRENKFTAPIFKEIRSAYFVELLIKNDILTDNEKAEDLADFVSTKRTDEEVLAKIFSLSELYAQEVWVLMNFAMFPEKKSFTTEELERYTGIKPDSDFAILEGYTNFLEEDYSAYEGEEIENLNDTLQFLNDTAWIEKDKNSNSYTIPPEIKKYILSNISMQPKYFEDILKRLESIIVKEGEKDQQYITEILEIIIHVGKIFGQTENDFIRLFRRFLRKAEENKDFEKAESFYLILVDIIEKNRPKELVAYYEEMAEFYKKFERYHFSKNYYEKAIEYSSSEKSVRIGKLQNSLALVLKDLGELEDARELVKKTIGIYKQEFGKSHTSTATIYHSLAVILKDLGQLEKAKEWMEKAIDIYEQNLGKNHANTATCYHNLANILQNLGQLEKAKEWIEKAIDIKEQNLEENNTSTATSYQVLALITREFRQLEKAKEWIEKAINLHEQKLGKKHTITAVSYYTLALILKDLGQLENAKKWVEKAVKIIEENLGKNHTITARSYNHLARIINDLGELDRAKELAEKATKILEENLGKNHTKTARSYDTLAMVLKAHHQFEEALLFSQKALDIWNTKFPNGHYIIDKLERNKQSILEEMENQK